MRLFRDSLLLAAALLCGGCFQLNTVIRVKGDGSGTIEQRLLLTRAALEQLKQLAVLGGGTSGGGAPFNPLSEEEARADAAKLGPGVTLLSTSPISDETGEGRVSTYAFTDINLIRVTQQAGVPRGAVREVDPDSQALTAKLTRQPSGHALLTIAVPEPTLPGSRTLSRPGRAPSAEQFAMVKQMFSGARISIAVQPEGTLVATTSAFVDGPRVTLMDVDVDQLTQDETLLARLQAAKSADELKLALKGAPGLKVNLDREITIEFVPAK